jgi:hypothetical protein
MTSPIGLATALRCQAQGIYSLEAATELLIGHRHWLHRTDFTRFIEVRPGLVNGKALAVIDWPAAITTLRAGRLPCSGGEHRILRIAASLAEGIPVDLQDTLTGLDDTNLELVVRAIRHASGNSECLKRAAWIKII